jgi:hypothetical protein
MACSRWTSTASGFAGQESLVAANLYIDDVNRQGGIEAIVRISRDFAAPTPFSGGLHIAVAW